jgi:hypothetical protein
MLARRKAQPAWEPSSSQDNPGALQSEEGRGLTAREPEENATVAEEKTYKATYAGSGTFIISKPRRKSAKRRQSRLKNPQRGARK